MDRTVSTVTRHFPSPSPDDLWRFPHFSASESSPSSSHGDSVTSGGESWTSRASDESVSELDRGKGDEDSSPMTSGTTWSDSVHDGAVTGPVDASVENASRSLGKDRLHALFSDYERVIVGHDQSDRGNAPSGHSDIAVTRQFSDVPISTSTEDTAAGHPRWRSQTLEPATGSTRQRNRPLCGQERRSRRQKNKMPSAIPHATKTARRGVQKKRVSTGKSQEYQFLRLNSARRTPSGSIEYKVIWKPSWVTLEDLRGKRALEEAEDLVLDKFGQPTWDTEMLGTGYMDEISESE